MREGSEILSRQATGSWFSVQSNKRWWLCRFHNLPFPWVLDSRIGIHRLPFGTCGSEWGRYNEIVWWLFKLRYYLWYIYCCLQTRRRWTTVKFSLLRAPTLRSWCASIVLCFKLFPPPLLFTSRFLVHVFLTLPSVSRPKSRLPPALDRASCPHPYETIPEWFCLGPTSLRRPID